MNNLDERAHIPPPGSAGGYEPRIPIAELVLTLGLRWRQLVAAALAVFILSALTLLLVRNRYTATVLLVPEGAPSTSLSTLSSLAALSNLSLGRLTPAESPQFYEALLRSRPIQYAVLNRRYGIPAQSQNSSVGDSATLASILKVQGKDPAEQLWKAAKVLSRMTRISTDMKTGIIRIAVEDETPRLSAAIANTYASELLRFNRESRQSQARLRRQFLEGRVASSSQELADAEAAVRAFLERNRQYESSPSLRFEFARLQRNVSVLEDLYLNLRRQLDAARIAEVDDIPVVTVIQEAIPPAQKSSPSRTALLIAFTFLGTLLAAGWILAAEKHENLFPGLKEALVQIIPTLPGFVRRWMAGAGKTEKQDPQGI